MAEQLTISVIVPAHNAGGHLGECLDGLRGSWPESFEIIVVDDASTDDTARIAQEKGVAVLRNPQQSGPAAARNRGAGEAKGEVFFFVDADVRVMEGAVAYVAQRFSEEPDVDALFGSYDDDPSEQDFLSQYKNLFHHYVHQQSSQEAVTFWAGCGAIRREVFEKAGGFDPERYREPSIEDIELGYRLRGMGYRIVLDKKLRGKHLKRWTLSSLLRADIFCRAVPWSMLMLERKEMATDLNLKWHSKASACLVGLLLLMLALAPVAGAFLFAACVILVILIALNLDFYRFLLRRRGLGFVIRAFPMHLLYYFYSGFTFVMCWAVHKRKGARGGPG